LHIICFKIGFNVVLGSFLYQLFFLGWLFGIEAIAVAELLVNIGQMLIGATVALPAARIVWQAFPQLKQTAK
jgi:hypothetical protein